MADAQSFSLPEKTQRLRILLGKMATDGGGLESVSSGLESVLGGSESLESAQQSLLKLNQLHGGESLSPEEAGQLEAIVLPRFRPALLIQNNSFAEPPAPWTHLGDDANRRRLELAFQSIGRVDLTNASAPYAGTAFVVGPGLMMTNRHVAEAFAIGVGQTGLVFRPGRSANINFKHEEGGPSGIPLKIRRVRMIHPYWDMALLEVEGLDPQQPVLTLEAQPFEELAERQTDIAVVGYPAFDPRNPDKNLQDEIFQKKYQVKRLQPGKLQPRQQFRSYNRQVNAGVHDASTLGGNSGSAVIDIQTGRVVALHFAGEYLKANYAVPASELAQDSRVVQAGVNFTPGAGVNAFYGQVWSALEGREQVAANPPRDGFGGDPATAPARSPVSVSQGSTTVTATTVNPGGMSVTWQIPLQITISIGTPQVLTAGAPPATPPHPPTAATEGWFNREPPPREPLEGFDLAAFADSGAFWRQAKSLALASQLAYWEPTDRTSQGAPSLVTSLTQWGFRKTQFLSQGATQCLFAAVNDTVLVAFRGTTNLADWGANLKVFDIHRPYGPVHRGFRTQFEDVRDDLERLLGSHPHTRLILTGHSLGGAIACVAAAEWAERAVPPTAIFTFGQPRTGHGEFVWFLNSRYPKNFHRFVNNRDIVPRVPPGYEHVGRLWKFDAAGRHDANAQESLVESPVPSDDSLSPAEFEELQRRLRQGATWEQAVGGDFGGGTAQESLFPSVDDHAIQNYVRILTRFADGSVA